MLLAPLFAAFSSQGQNVVGWEPLGVAAFGVPESPAGFHHEEDHDDHDGEEDHDHGGQPHLYLHQQIYQPIGDQGTLPGDAEGPVLLPALWDVYSTSSEPPVVGTPEPGTSLLVSLGLLLALRRRR